MVSGKNRFHYVDIKYRKLYVRRKKKENNGYRELRLEDACAIVLLE